MVALPVNEKSVAYLVDRQAERELQEPNRAHLGGSQIGGPCDRKLWYSFRWIREPDFDGRMLRLFARGHEEEARFARWLTGIDVEVLTTNPKTGKQFDAAIFGGHFGLAIDGLARSIPEAPKTPHTLEFKTFADKYFQELKAKGVREAKPEHYAQCIIGMHLRGLTRCLYLAVNKNDDELYDERIEADPVFAEQLIERARRTIEAERPPARLNSDPDFWHCAMCDFRYQCHFEEVAEANCRTCLHSTPVIDEGGEYAAGGRWTCAKVDKFAESIPLAVQRKGGKCPSHLLIPDLVPFARVTDATEDRVDYQVIASDRTFANGNEKADGCYLSRELSAMAVSQIADPGIDALREMFDGEVVEGGPVCQACEGRATYDDVPCETCNGTGAPF